MQPVSWHRADPATLSRPCSAARRYQRAAAPRTDRMNALGRFTDDRAAITLDIDRGIAMTERDINELAQAKGANVAGFRVAAAGAAVFQIFEHLDALANDGVGSVAAQIGDKPDAAGIMLVKWLIQTISRWLSYGQCNRPSST